MTLSKHVGKLELQNVKIHNFGTFQKQEILFKPELNAIIGETGSGKSLIMDALAILLGQRADKKFVRSGSEFATLEASFLLKGNNTFIFQQLEELGHPMDSDEIIIRRIIYSNGKSKNFLNLEQCTLTVLQKFCCEHVDLVGQFENQKLLSPQYQLEMVDSFTPNFVEKKQYQLTFQKYKKIIQELEELMINETEMDQKKDYLEFQINEIKNFNPILNEEEDLLKKKKKILSMDEKRKQVSKMSDFFSNSEEGSGILTNLKNVQINWMKTKELFSNVVAEKLETSILLLHEVHDYLLSENDEDLSEEEIAKIIERLDLLQKLKRKHGGTVETMLQNLIKYENDLKAINSKSDIIAELEAKKEIYYKELMLIAEKVSFKREKSAQSVSEKLSLKLQKLNMVGSQVNLKISKVEDLQFSGQDRLEFLVRTNKGENFYHLTDIVSGGELSRILLCLRQMSVESGKVSIFLFDEVDAGIGGETALLIGKTLKELSRELQVLVITHLPQIASQANHLIKVEKNIIHENDRERTASMVTHLDEKKSILNEAKKMSALH